MATIVDVRLAVPADAVDIAAISRDYIEQGLSWRWNYDRVLRAIGDPETNVAVVGGPDSLAAFGIMSYANEDAHLSLLGVRRSSQRKGVGSAVLSWLERVAAIAGCARLLVEARQSNSAAQAFYLAHGYHVLYKQEAMYSGVEDEIGMQKWLRDA